MRVYDDPRILPNLDGLGNVEALERFVWQTVHKRFYGRRDEWFAQFDERRCVLWWIPDGHRPTLTEGVERLDHLKAHGPSESRLRLAAASRRRNSGRRRAATRQSEHAA